MNQNLATADSRTKITTASQSSKTCSWPTRSTLRFLLLATLLLPACLAPTGANAQATLDGDTLTISTVVIGDERFTIQMRIKPETDPMQLDVISAVAKSSTATPSAITFVNDVLTVPSLSFNGSDYWLSLSTLTTDPPVMQLDQLALNDADDDDDGRADEADAFPYDANETDDTDADGIGNNADTDDDNDGVLDADDALPLVADYSAVLTLADNFTAGVFLEESMIEPVGTDTDNAEGLGRYEFAADGSATFAFPEGSQTGSWTTSNNTLIVTLEDGPGLDFTTTAVGTPDYLLEQMVIELVPDATRFDIRYVLKRRELQLVARSGTEHTFWVTDHVEISILNDAVNLAWFGTTDPTPVEVAFESALQVESQTASPNVPFTAEQLVDQRWALPLQFTTLGPNQLVFGTTGPVRESLADDALMLRDALVSFQTGGAGMNHSTGQAFTWSLAEDGTLQVTSSESGDDVSLQITQTLQNGYEVIASASKNGRSYYRKAQAMQQVSDLNFDTAFGEYLVRDFYVFNPDNIGSDGRIKFTANDLSLPFKAYKFAADGTAVEHRTVINSASGTIFNVILPVTWKINGTAATVSRKTNASCDTAAANCVTERREWQILNYSNGRLYVLEETYYPAVSESESSYEIGQYSDIHYYDLYKLSAEEESILMENLSDQSAL